MYMGSRNVSMTVIFDTGSSVYWVPVESCDDNCYDAKLYDTSESTYYSQTSNSLRKLTYGSGSVYGYPSKDRVCLNNPELLDNDID